MSYDKFFKEARAAKKTSRNMARGTSPVAKNTKPKRGGVSTASVKKSSISKAMKKRNRKNWSSFPVGSFLGFVALFLLSFWVILEWENIERYADQVEVKVFGQAFAKDEAADKGGKKESAKSQEEEKSAENSKTETTLKAMTSRSWTDEELALFSKLEERKRKLDMKEAELNRLEEELQRQKTLLDERMRDLASVRENIANKLMVQVEIDEKKVQRLVDFYSNMKPSNAAKVFAKLNEDLAVEVLGKMKKKNAADIMNLLDPEKSQRLSEKYTGYKRR